jgi:hypothetical protein
VTLTSSYLNQGKLFKEKLLARGYNKLEINRGLNEIKYENRLIGDKRDRGNARKAPPLVLSTRFHPCTSRLRGIIRKHWPLITQCQVSKQVFSNPPIIAYRRDRNLSELLHMRK